MQKVNIGNSWGGGKFCPKIAVLLPCYNEAASIAKVVAAFQQVLPDATVYVYDNNSKDNTAELARKAGAVVRSELYQGKGNVVRRMFADIDADIYVMSDGDETYDASAAPDLIAKLLLDDYDMVVGAREETDVKAYRTGHRFGNRMLTGMVKRLFGQRFEDILSGYRVFSRRYVKSFPVVSSGFEIETEMSIHALQMRLHVCEVPAKYGARPEESPSKLRTYRDGFRILFTIIGLMSTERPRLLFGSMAFVLLLLALILAAPIVMHFAVHGTVPRYPTAIFCTGLVIVSVLTAVFGFLLHTIHRGRIEAKHLAYLQYESPQQLTWGTSLMRPYPQHDDPL